VAVRPGNFQQTTLAKFFSFLIRGFCDAVAIHDEDIASGHLLFDNVAFKAAEQPNHGGSGLKVFRRQWFTLVAQQQRREVSAIYVAESPACVVVVAEEKRGVTTIASSRGKGGSPIPASHENRLAPGESIL
jgi:hypothetical protein